MRMVPALGVTRPNTRSTSVVFPEPDGPAKAVMRPAGMTHDTWCSTGTVSYANDTLSNAIPVWTVIGAAVGSDAPTSRASADASSSLRTTWNPGSSCTAYRKLCCTSISRGTRRQNRKASTSVVAASRCNVSIATNRMAPNSVAEPAIVATCARAWARVASTAEPADCAATA